MYLLRLFIAGFVLVLSQLASAESTPSALTQSNQMPAGAVQAGTLTNQKLQQDAMAGIISKAAMKGCDRPTDVKPYVMNAPAGEPGSRMWVEQWVIACATGKITPIIIDFREDGMNAASFTIK